MILDQISYHFQRLVSLLFPRYVSKYFPPDITKQDPVYQIIKHALRKNKTVYLLLFDIKQFGNWSEKYDERSIQQVLNLIRNMFKTHTKQFFIEDEILLIKQLWGDDFLLVISGHDTQTNFDMIKKRGCKLITKVRTEVIKLVDHSFKEKIQFHYGYAQLIPNKEIMVETLVQQAWHSAHSIAKKRDHSNYSHIKEEIRHVIEQESINIYAQPIVSLNGTGLEGFEILTRGPEDSVYHEPIQLFTLAQKTDFLFSLEMLVLKKVFKMVDEREISCPIFINLTADTLQKEAFIPQVQKLLEEYPIFPTKMLIFELSALEEIKHLAVVKERVNALRKFGIRFAIDDVGTGFWSLQYIGEILPEVIKIDRSVIMDIEKSLVKETILNALLHIAKKIEAKVVAEGIERPEELELLLKNRVVWGQGYLFGKPSDQLSSIK